MHSGFLAPDPARFEELTCILKRDVLTSGRMVSLTKE
jgi:hypothetical protein